MTGKRWKKQLTSTGKEVRKATPCKWLPLNTRGRWPSQSYATVDASLNGVCAEPVKKCQKFIKGCPTEVSMS